LTHIPSLGRRAGLTALLGMAAAACTPLSAFNTLGPRDPALRPGKGLAFGPLPRQKLDVYAPKGGAGTAPVLIFFYGGSWSSGRRQDYGFVGQALAAQGFVTLVPDYRLFPEVRYPDFLTDSALAVKWAQDHAAAFGGDPDRIILSGHSAGAYNAAMLALDPRYLSQAGVRAGSVRGFVGLAGPYDFFPFDVQATQDSFGQAPDGPGTQPIRHVSAEAPPMLLLSGDRDTTVKPRNSKALAAALTAVGVKAEVKLYPGVDHTDIVAALSRTFRSKAPVLEDLSRFAHAQTALAQTPTEMTAR
jgi:acetyl esterase/lipase